MFKDRKTNNFINQCKKTWDDIKNFFTIDDEKSEENYPLEYKQSATEGFLAMAQSLQKNMKNEYERSEDITNSITHVTAGFIAKKYFDGDQEALSHMHKLADLITGKNIDTGSTE